MRKFTDLFVKNLKPRESEYTVRETDGFAVRVRPSGGKSFLFVYDFLGVRRNFTLGSYPAMSLKEAHQAHRQAQNQIAQGIDPAEAKRQQIAARKIQRSKDAAEPTIKALVTEYLEHAKRHKRSWETDQMRLQKYVLPAWGDRKATDVSRRDVALLLDKSMKNASSTGAGTNRLLALIRRLFAFGIERGLLENSPAYRVRNLAPEIASDRTLSHGEIKEFWEQLETLPVPAKFKIALKLQLLLGLRAGEINVEGEMGRH